MPVIPLFFGVEVQKIFWLAHFRSAIHGWRLRRRPHSIALGLSQTLTRAVGRTGSASILHFVILRETEAEREQLVLLAHRPGAGKAEALAQPHMQRLDRLERAMEALRAEREEERVRIAVHAVERE